MEEILDLFDRHGKPLGQTMRRGDKAPEGAYWRVCDAWFVDECGRLLMQRRSLSRPVNPGLWSCTGGHIRHGETPEEGCLREVREELGIDADLRRGEKVMEYCGSRAYHDIWLFRQNIPLAALSLDPEEVCDAQWFTIEEVRALMRQGLVSPLGYLEQLLTMLPILCPYGKE